jgi:hypothetical protein
MNKKLTQQGKEAPHARGMRGMVAEKNLPSVSTLPEDLSKR